MSSSVTLLPLPEPGYSVLRASPLTDQSDLSILASPLCRVPRDSPAEVKDLINSCMTNNPKDRPTALEVYNMLVPLVRMQMRHS
jgi:serine/threonine protein kinase